MRSLKGVDNNRRQQWLLLGRTMAAVLLICSSFTTAEAVGEITQAGLVYQDSNGISREAPLLSTSVEMNVSGLINRVSVKQVFENDSSQWINAVYLFPLPENAAVDHLTMRIGRRVIIGEIKQKAEAQQIYEQAEREGKKAALVEQQRGNMFTTKAANIGPGEKLTIEIEYQHSVSYKSGLFSLRFPMAITPRYAPAVTPLSTEERHSYLAGLFLNKEQEVEGERASQDWIWLDKWQRWQDAAAGYQLAEQTVSMIKTSADPALLVDIKINLHTPLPTTDIQSPYHGLKIENREADFKVISLFDSTVLADRDFVLNWSLQQTEQAESSVFVQEKAVGSTLEKYGLVMMVPPAMQFTENARIAKEVILVIDVSGSMSGTSIAQAKSALSFAVDQLAENDTFNIIAFSNNTEFFAGNSLPVDNRSRIMAKSFINQLQAGGGTNMQAALNDALSEQRTVYPNEHKDLRQVLFITDASISNEEQLLTQIKQQLGASRLFMVGIGSAPNHYFMKSSAQLGRGTYTSIGDVNEVRSKMSALFTQLSAPVLRDIKLTWENGSEVDYWPKPLTDLYQGEPLQVVMKIPSGENKLQVSGLKVENGAAQKWTQVLSLDQEQNGAGIDILWAKEQIDSIELNRELPVSEKKQLITALGLNYHIVTKHTSLVAVEQQVTRPLMLSSVDKQVKTHLPKGNTMSLPQTGLGSGLYLRIALMLLLSAAVLWAAERLLRPGISEPRA
ncbi:marine proteobacterial sortase target protein [Psychromonas ossibalaenae]|uniref:marine proteobacterial sortase target protein n=1 Tax=Psychromonas ossibalaenae TaxID=444922 RepID=UPI00035C716A|nr:marine proteobacterial sortase target protein [Psychromonas ossibalaenae]